MVGVMRARGGGGGADEGGMGGFVADEPGSRGAMRFGSVWLCTSTRVWQLTAPGPWGLGSSQSQHRMTRSSPLLVRSSAGPGVRTSTIQCRPYCCAGIRRGGLGGWVTGGGDFVPIIAHPANSSLP